MHDLSGHLLVASGVPPAGLRFALADLGSRLLAAQVYQVHELDEDGQVRALIERAASRGLALPNDAALYLVHHVRRDMHSLCRTFDRLDIAAMAAQRRLTVPFLRDVLESQPADSS